MKFSITNRFIVACVIVYWPAVSFSHIVLESKTATAGTAFKAVLQVGPGCNGAATTTIAVQIPPGFQAVQPYPKAGWAISIDADKLVSWTATSKEAALQHAHFDEFVLRGKLPDAVGPMWFKVLQTCHDGASSSSNHWADMPATGVSTRGLKHPAALLEVTAPAASAAPMPSEHKH
jgi:uncharacterized protein YcnI